MIALLAYPVAIAAALVTTLAVLAIWVGHSRVVDGNSTDSVFWSFVFLFVPLVFFVALASNVAAIAIGQIIALDGQRAAWPAVVAAGVFVWSGCAWTQRGSGGLVRGAAPVSALPVALFALTDMVILAGGLMLLPGQSLF